MASEELTRALQDELPAADRQDLVSTAVDAAPDDEKPAVAQAAVDALPPDQRSEFVKSLIPQESRDRRAVFIAGFVIAAIIALGLGAIAWGAANTDNEGVATAAIAAALSLPSAIIGGLLGAYTSK